MKKIVALALAGAFAVNAQAQSEGKPAAMADSPLKPHAARMTETPMGDIPVSKL